MEVVFGRLDPLLKTLLPLVSRFQVIVQSESRDCSALIQLMHLQTQVLESIKEVIGHLDPYFSQTLIILMDYVSLPLITILHISAPFMGTARGDIIWKDLDHRCESHIRKLNQTAARVIQIYIQTSCSNENIGSGQSIRHKDIHISNFLVAIVNVLPALPLKSSSAISLDNGVELCISLSEAILALIQVCPGEALHRKWKGNLVIKLADFATSMTLVENLHLSLLSLEILDCLLTKVKRRELWQRIFPGIFASMYRRLIKINLQARAGLPAKIEATSLKVVEGLIRASTSMSVIREAIDVKYNKLHQLQLLANEPTANDVRNVPRDTEPEFLLQLRRRVVGPLGDLLRQYVTSSSECVRIRLISLCESILLDSRDCWHSTSLPEQALDTCLILRLEESRGKVTPGCP